MCWNRAKHYGIVWLDRRPKQHHTIHQSVRLTQLLKDIWKHMERDFKLIRTMWTTKMLETAIFWSVKICQHGNLCADVQLYRSTLTFLVFCWASQWRNILGCICSGIKCPRRVRLRGTVEPAACRWVREVKLDTRSCSRPLDTTTDHPQDRLMCHFHLKHRSQQENCPSLASSNLSSQYEILVYEYRDTKKVVLKT